MANLGPPVANLGPPVANLGPPVANLGQRSAQAMGNHADFRGDPRRACLGTQRAECSRREHEERRQHDDAAKET
ncbi:hypothetical protein WME79_33970 [Sorangium sp. So ce726]|uniref:hypothetical protein n=1 Tax=Sorangium sp. So ce726 TaxID=3133319 RepID=UPI003F615106